MGKKSKKKIVIVVAVCALLLAAVVTGVVFYADSQTEAKYNGAVTKADQYLENQEYEKAETAYLSAIDLDPKKEPAYIKLADLYVDQHKEGEALSLLKTATQEIPDSERLKVKYDEIDSSDYVEVMKAYNEFLSQDTITFEGRPDDTNGKWANSDCKFALVYISNEEIPELLVCTKDYIDYFGGHEGALFQYKDGSVQQVEERYQMNICDEYQLGYYPGTGYYMDVDETAIAVVLNIDDAGKDVYNEERFLMWGWGDSEDESGQVQISEYSMIDPGAQESRQCSKAEFDSTLKKATDNKDFTPYEFFENTKENRQKRLLK